jgi:hypothetical protein
LESSEANVGTLQQQALDRAFLAGHFFSPDALQIDQVTTLEDARKLSVYSPVAVAALRSMSMLEAGVYTEAVELAHNRQPDFDGIMGPAMTALVQTPRCSVPDFAPPPGTNFAFGDSQIDAVARQMQEDKILQATGRGNWAHCHDVGDYHAAVVRVQTQGVPSFLRPVFKEVLTEVRRAYAAIGLRFDFIDENRKNILTGESAGPQVNIEMSFVSSSSGWIGLAILGNGQGCASNIWCRYLATYRGGSSPAAIKNQWITLIKHELGHNCGLDHTNGGVMNPYIIASLPFGWVPSDPSTSRLKNWYGGKPVPLDEPEPPKPPTPPTPEPDDLEKRVEDLERKVLVMKGVQAWVLARLNETGQ